MFKETFPNNLIKIKFMNMNNDEYVTLDHKKSQAAWVYLW